MSHQFAKTLIIIRVIEMISKKYRISIEEARDRLYNSRLIDLIDDDETGLYGEPPLYVFSIYEYEVSKQSKKDFQ